MKPPKNKPKSERVQRYRAGRNGRAREKRKVEHILLHFQIEREKAALGKVKKVSREMENSSGTEED